MKARDITAITTEKFSTGYKFTCTLVLTVRAIRNSLTLIKSTIVYTDTTLDIVHSSFIYFYSVKYIDMRIQAHFGSIPFPDVFLILFNTVVLNVDSI